MMSALQSPRERTGAGASLFLLVAGLAAFLMTMTGCGSDTPGQQSCSEHSDCEIGMVCGADSECVEVECEFCANDPDLVCIQNDEGKNVCSSAQCVEDADCPNAGETCTNGQCVNEECTSSADCPGEQMCNAFGKCADPAGADTGVPDTGMADAGDTGVSPDTGGDQDTGTGDQDTGMDEQDTGVDKCANVNCPGGKRCDPNTGQCVDNDCMKTCPENGRPQYDKLDPNSCECVECTGDNHCSNGETCRTGICQAPCQTSCTPANADQKCTGDTPFCIGSCCVQCVGKSDCSNGEVCVDGTCKNAPNNCTPGNCPAGTTCNQQSGKCEQQSSGMSCNPQDPSSCPGQFEFCDPMTKKCQSPTGGQQCGTCGANCMCPGNSTCQQFVCTGCQHIGPGPDCPSGQACLPLQGGICLPLNL